MLEGMANRRRSIAVLALIRSLVELTVVSALTAWGFLSWQLPLPGIIIGFVTFFVSVLVWALFLSPKPVLAVDGYARGLVSLLFLAAGCAAMLKLGFPWYAVLLFTLVAATLNYTELVLRTKPQVKHVG
ncbi:DUF2568 domain-containing protein [Leucobacter sp. OH1287]|nr:DUF2568 domain-containing protein [Leucobacter sp. OH1287]